jgi:hypothetical protein
MAAHLPHSPDVYSSHRPTGCQSCIFFLPSVKLLYEIFVFIALPVKTFHAQQIMTTIGTTAIDTNPLAAFCADMALFSAVVGAVFFKCFDIVFFNSFLIHAITPPLLPQAPTSRMDRVISS